VNASAAASATTSATDAELVEAVRTGDESAFEELYRRYRPPVHAFVVRRVRDEGRAEELTQEAFLSALRRLRETKAAVNFRPWIYEIARNSTIDHFRRTSRTDEVSVDAVEKLRPSEHLRLVSDRGPHREVAAKQDLETLRGAFDELSERHERIIVMRELEGLSYREIGERLELTRPGVESTLFRARRKLETEFAELDTGRRCVAVRGALGRLAGGTDLRGDLGMVKRHTRRCAHCRAAAKELGVAPERSRVARIGALLPLPALPAAFGAKATAAAVMVAALAGGAGLGGAIKGGSERRAAPVQRAAGRAPAVPASERRAASVAVRPARARIAPARASVTRATIARFAAPAGVALEVAPPKAVAPMVAAPAPGSRAGPVRQAPLVKAPASEPSQKLLRTPPRELVERGVGVLGGVLDSPHPPAPPAAPRALRIALPQLPQ
jgi:RNA polymerase sigma factor (sigma-70 family)